MDTKQLVGSRIENIKQQMSAHQADLWTSLPAVVVSYDPVQNTVVLQPLIQGKRFYPDGTKNVDMPLLVDVPVLFTQASGCTITVPINQGDAGIVIFSSRCIDAPWELGPNDGNGRISTSPALEMRMHDLSDGMFFPCSFSKRQAPVNINTEKLEIRTNSLGAKITIDPSTFDVEIYTMSVLNINAGQVRINADIITNGALYNNGHNISNTHTHTSTSPGTLTSVVT